MADKIYNPYDILLFIDNNKLFDNYWFGTGTPTFLIKLVQSKNYFLPDFENIEMDKKLNDSFDIENLDLETIMFQSGYLTIEKVIQKRRVIKYKLNFPNFEVKTSFYDFILYYTVDKLEKVRISDALWDIFESGEMDDLENIIKRLFASISYHNYTKNEIANYEGTAVTF